jgi:vanillate monooxygenase
MSTAAENPSVSSWPRQAWYVAARSDELSNAPLGRRICNVPMVFWRNERGQVAALEDFCPHRGAPLSLGILRGGNLVCGYHGLVMGCEGRAVAMPGQNVAPFPPIRAFPTIERHGFVWVWPGHHALASPDTLPPLFWADNPKWAYGGGHFHIDCDYRLMIDNLMDLTHETYVHANSIGQKEIDEAPVSTAVAGNDVITSRFMDNVSAPPFWQMALRSAGLPEDEPVDRWQICRFTLPSHVMIEVGVALAGNGGYHAPLHKKVSSIVVDFITPESETSHWYFWGMARQFGVDDPALTEKVRAGQGQIFSEDREMLERQQANLLIYPGRKLLKLNIDAGGARSRIAITKAVAREIS